MADMIGSARRRRGTVRECLTWIEIHIIRLEEKEGLTPSDQRKIKRMKELAKERNCDFEQHHIRPVRT